MKSRSENVLSESVFSEHIIFENIFKRINYKMFIKKHYTSDFLKF